MQFSVFFFATALVASASLAMSATVTAFSGASCTGAAGPSFQGPPGGCFSLGNGSTQSFGYSGVTDHINFYISGGGHNDCTNGANLTRGAGSGCGTAPSG